LTDHRRRLPIEKRGTVLDAPPEFMLVVSYNPGYQSVLKDLKQSTRQRFVGDGIRLSDRLKPRRKSSPVKARLTRARRAIWSPSGRRFAICADTDSKKACQPPLIYAAQMMPKGIAPVDAAEVAFVSPITDDRELQRSIREIVTTII
jgi:nitric oxide reductase NorQ protein